MSNQYEQIKRDIVSAIKSGNPHTESYDTTAEVLYVDGDTAWVRIPGGAPETPVEKSVAAKQGDIVQVRIANGRAWINGNNTAPPTDDTVAIEAHTVATETHEAVEELEEHFWYDGSGAHVEGESYRNDMKSDGLHIVEKSTGETVARFGADGSQLGKDSEGHGTFDYHSMRFADVNGNVYFQVLDERGRDGKKTYNEHGLVSTISGNTIYLMYPIADDNIHVYIGTTEVSDYTYGNSVGSNPRGYIHLSSTPSGTTYEVQYNTDADYLKHFTFGTRMGTSYGHMSASFGEDNAVYGRDGFAAGRDNQVIDYSCAFGIGLIGQIWYQALFGSYNKQVDASLIVGNGTDSNNRSNAFEVYDDGTVKTAKGTLTAQTDTTTWTAPTVYNSTCTVSDGGYMAEGKHVYIQLKLNLSSSLAAGTALQVFSGMPTPAATNGVLSVLFSNNGGGGAYVSTQGNLVIKTPSDLSVTSSTNIYITGHYVTA